MLLYIHVPFCRSKCSYCAFYSLPVGEAGLHKAVTGYITGLLREMALWHERLGSVKIESIFFGGGTPSLLPGEALKGILEKINNYFQVEPGAEISIEANPESALAPGWLHAARQAGFNRLSLGVQNFDEHILNILGRVHTAREAAYTCELARDAGFGNISLDLMWGLADAGTGQSQAQWLRQLKKAVELKPEHISAYGLALEPETTLQKACDRGDYALPGEKELASMYVAGAEFLESGGYMQYEISNFARMGYECRHNNAYWNGVPYLGLGPAATSTVGSRRWTNPENIEAWQKRVQEKTIGQEYEEIDENTRLKEMIMLRLRTSKGLPLKEWQTLRGTPFLKEFAALTGALQKNGLASSRKDYFRLTRAGMLVSNTIISHFFDSFE